jgi:hypothetical protein
MMVKASADTLIVNMNLLWLLKSPWFVCLWLTQGTDRHMYINGSIVLDLYHVLILSWHIAIS